MLLELKNIAKKFKLDKDNYVYALNDINLNFNKGEFVSIVGPSGSGKSTLLNILAGLDIPSSGSLIISDRSSDKFKKKDWDLYRKNNVGFVFQNFNLIEHLTALENVEIVMSLIGMSFMQRRKRAKKLLEQLGLKEYMNHVPDELSGGQKQRVAIARALANDPDIILADEPTGALDSKTGTQIMQVIKQISKDKLVIMVTHNLELAKKYSTRIVEISDGKVKSDNAIEKVDINNEKSNLNKKDTSMSFFEAFRLSLKNMGKKWGRVLITTIAGCIGIIGFCLILGLGNGANMYIDKQLIRFANANVLTLSKDFSLDQSGKTKNLKSDYDLILNKEYIKQNVIDKRFHIPLTNTSISPAGSDDTSISTADYDKAASINFNALAPSDTLGYLNENLKGSLPTKNSAQLIVNQAAARNILKQINQQKSDDEKIDINDTSKIIGQKVIMSIQNAGNKEFEIVGLIDEIDISISNIYYDYTFMSNWLDSINVGNESYLNILKQNYSYDLIIKNPSMAKDVSDYIAKKENGGTGYISYIMMSQANMKGYYANNLSVILKNAFSQAIMIAQIVISVFIIISLVVSSIMTSIVLYSSVLERRKEIGVIKAVGGRNKDVMRIFESEAILMGLFSAVLGITLSFVLSPLLEKILCNKLNLNLPGLVTIPVSVVPFTNISFRFATVICIVIFSCLVSFIAGYLPSKKATKMHVIDALRDE